MRQIILIRAFAFTMFVYLFWVWFVGFDESIVPDSVKTESWTQGDTLYFPNIVLMLHDYRIPLAFFSLALICLKNSLGKWGFLLFSVTGPTMYFSDGWLYKTDFLENLEYAVQMIQGALLALCFFGTSAKEFTLKFKFKNKEPTR